MIPTTLCNPRAAAAEPLAGGLAFSATLMPHRSLSRFGFTLLMGFFAAVSLAIGIAFLMIGAWPVIGFCGLDVALVWLAFRLNYRSGLLREHLDLSEGLLTVRRILPSGRVREWRFQPYWLRVEMDDPPRHDSRLTLSSHGRRLTVGDFLTAAERHQVARDLRAALSRLRCVPLSIPAG